MSDLRYAVLSDRVPIAVAGPEARSFLQGLVSNDMNRVGPERAIYAAFLTPQGKFLHDLFIGERDGGFLLDCEAERRDDLIRRLKIYRLRAKADIAPGESQAVAVAYGQGAAGALGLSAEAGQAAPFAGGLAYVDPRLAAAGARLILPADDAEAALSDAGFTRAEADDYDRYRLSLGLPDGSRDMEVEKATLLECGFEELNGVDFEKGCYLGQELTARTKHRGLVKKRLLPVAIEGAAPVPGTPITLDGRNAGEIRSARDGAGLALIRLDALDKARAEGLPLMAGETPLAAWTPDWMTLPAGGE